MTLPQFIFQSLANHVALDEKFVSEFDIASINGDSATLLRFVLHRCDLMAEACKIGMDTNDGFRAALLCRQLPAARGLKKRKSSEDVG